jgi:hypothetical protein
VIFILKIIYYNTAGLGFANIALIPESTFHGGYSGACLVYANGFHGIAGYVLTHRYAVDTNVYHF